jgi:hypothetical protein
MEGWRKGGGTRRDSKILMPVHTIWVGHAPSLHGPAQIPQSAVPPAAPNFRPSILFAIHSQQFQALYARSDIALHKHSAARDAPPGCSSRPPCAHPVPVAARNGGAAGSAAPLAASPARHIRSDSHQLQLRVNAHGSLVHRALPLALRCNGHASWLARTASKRSLASPWSKTSFPSSAVALPTLSPTYHHY